jgi:hypothetical protein
MSRYAPLDYRGQHDPDDWPRIRTDVDDDRPATDDEVEDCDRCGAAVLEWELLYQAGMWCCESCLEKEGDDEAKERTPVGFDLFSPAP